MKKNLTLIAIISTLSIFGCTKKEPAKPIDYYVAHIDEARQVLKDCQARVKTASDLPKIMAEENCANASLAEDRWSEQYNSNVGKHLTPHKILFK